MMPSPEKNRSVLCHLITDFHSAAQRKMARLDFLGAGLSGLLLVLLVGLARLLMSR